MPIFPGTSSWAKTRIAEKAGGQDQADDHRQDSRPVQVGMRQQQRGEGQHAQDGDPNHQPAAESITQRPADDGAGRHRAKKDEEVDERRLLIEPEFAHQIERV